MAVARVTFHWALSWVPEARGLRQLTWAERTGLQALEAPRGSSPELCKCLQEDSFRLSLWPELRYQLSRLSPRCMEC